MSSIPLPSLPPACLPIKISEIEIYNQPSVEHQHTLILNITTIFVHFLPLLYLLQFLFFAESFSYLCDVWTSLQNVFNLIENLVYCEINHPTCNPAWSTLIGRGMSRLGSHCVAMPYLLYHKEPAPSKILPMGGYLLAPRWSLWHKV